MKPAPALLAGIRLLLPTTRARGVQAGIAALMSRVAFDKLDGPQRSKLDAELIQIYKPFGIYPWWRFRPEAGTSDQMACERAVAMWRLDLPTAVPDVSWNDILHSWHKQAPIQLIQDFRPFHADTDAALDYLASVGVQLPPGLHYGQRWLQNARAAAPNP